MFDFLCVLVFYYKIFERKKLYVSGLEITKSVCLFLLGLEKMENFRKWNIREKTFFDIYYFKKSLKRKLCVLLLASFQIEDIFLAKAEIFISLCE